MATEWYNSLNAHLKINSTAAAHNTTAAAADTVTSGCGDMEMLSSSPVTHKSISASAASKKPKSVAHVTKNVNREMKELYAAGELQLDVSLTSYNNKSVGEYLLEKWILSQRLRVQSE